VEKKEEEDEIRWDPRAKDSSKFLKKSVPTQKARRKIHSD
jgi:hypothetical protein